MIHVPAAPTRTRNLLTTAMTTLIAASLTAAPLIADIPEGSPVADALKRAESAAAAIVAVPPDKRTFENTVVALDDVVTRLQTETGLTQFMAHVSTDAKEREAGQTAEEHVSNWLIELGKREDVYHAVKAFADTKPKLEGEAARLLAHTMRDYRRAGMDLAAEQREKLKQIEKEIVRLGLEFEKNIRQDETRVPLTVDELRGASAELLATIPRSGDLYLVGMDYPTFNPLLEQAENEITRQKVWTAYKRRGGKVNVAILENVLALRAEAAKLLNYASAADFETEVRMSKSAAAVRKFYDQLRPLVRKKAQLDLDELTAAKREHTGDAKATLRPWDQPFYEQYLMKKRYAVDSEKVREYFPMQRVVDGLFSITQSLYGLEYRDVTARAGTKDRPLWHPDVKLYEVWDKATNQLLGEFYLDLYPRPNKYSHAAQWGLIEHKVYADGTSQRPLAALVCNFTKPTPDKPSLLTHEEVETFFHEFGHCLHTIVSEARYGRFSGTSVARDFVEAPSQMFENWVWDADVLRTFARHYQTGEPFPDALLDGMLKARYLASGLKAEHQFYYGLVDLTYHSSADGKLDTTKTQNDLFAQTELFAPVSETYFQASFGHLMGYQAGYYGYMWSLVYAQDIFSRFKELGMLSPEAGMYYRKKILARGGTVDEIDLVRDYLGREPDMKPFLEHLGLKAP
ncbi:MAG: M3 family metallopeptidase [Phycisphaerae bacterium]